MSIPNRDTQIKQAADTANIFSKAYYDALNSSRRKLSAALNPFYTTACAAYNAHPPDISINGRHMTSPADYAALLEEHYHKEDRTLAEPPKGPASSTSGSGSTAPQVRFDIESLDAHVVNPDYNLAAPPHVQNSPDASGAKCSILVQVTGRVHYGRGRDAPAKVFNEVFVLVPNWDMFAKNPPKGARRWLISSQNFRAL